MSFQQIQDIRWNEPCDEEILMLPYVEAVNGKEILLKDGCECKQCNSAYVEKYFHRYLDTWTLYFYCYCSPGDNVYDVETVDSFEKLNSPFRQYA